MTDLERHKRYQNLVNKNLEAKWRDKEPLTHEEEEEMERLGKEIDRSYDWFYEPIIARLEARIKELKG